MPVHIRRVLVCVKLNESLETVDFACALAERFGAELHVLHVLDETPEPDVAALSPEETTYARGGEDAVLKGIVPPSWEEKLICRKAVTFGVAWIAITHYAREQRIDVIVLGASHRSILGHWLMGSVADQVVHHLPCPVLVIPDAEGQFPVP